MDILNSETYKVAVTIVRDFSSIISMLSAGFGAVVGLYVTNKWQDRRLLLQQQKEDERKERERTMSLRKEIFLEYLELVEKQFSHLEKFPNVQDSTIQSLITEHSTLNRYSYRLHLIAKEQLLLHVHVARNVFVNSSQSMLPIRFEYDVIRDRRDSILNIPDKNETDIERLNELQSCMRTQFLTLIKRYEITNNALRDALKNVINDMRIELGDQLSEEYIGKVFAASDFDYESLIDSHVESMSKIVKKVYD